MNILSKAPLVIGRFYLSIFNKKKLRELDEKMSQVSKNAGSAEAVSGWKPLSVKE